MADSAFLLFKMIGALSLTLALAVLIIKYLLPKLMPGRAAKAASIQILEYQPLEYKKAIYIVKIEDKKLAIATSENGISKICDL